MNRFLSFFILCVIAITGCGDDPVTVTPTTGTIQGKVLDGNSVQGLYGVSILTQPPTSAVITKSDGTFSIANIAPGTYNLTASRTGYTTKSISVSVTAGVDTKADFLLFPTPPNSSPVLSPNFLPKDKDTTQTSNVSFSWSAIDPDGDSIGYNFFLGKSEQNLELKAENLSTSVFQINDLEKGTTYYWKVTAKDSKGNITEGTIWRFTTKGTIASGGLSAYYTFTGNAQDESGNGFNGQVSGAVLTTDRFNQPNSAYQFDGNDDYILVPNASTPLLEPTSEISLSCFIYTNQSSGISPYSRIIRKSAPLKGGYHLSWDQNFNNKLGAIVNYESSGNLQAEEVTTSNSAYLGKWHHIVFTYSKNSKTGKLYIDGDLVASKPNLQYLLQHSDSNLFIGGTTGQGVNQTFPGKIDDVRIYNRALTESEINEIYHEGGFGI